MLSTALTPGRQGEAGQPGISPEGRYVRTEINRLATTFAICLFSAGSVVASAGPLTSVTEARPTPLPRTRRTDGHTLVPQGAAGCGTLRARFTSSKHRRQPMDPSPSISHRWWTGNTAMAWSLGSGCRGTGERSSHTTRRRWRCCHPAGSRTPTVSVCALGCRTFLHGVSGRAFAHPAAGQHIQVW